MVKNRDFRGILEQFCPFLASRIGFEAVLGWFWYSSDPGVVSHQVRQVRKEGAINLQTAWRSPRSLREKPWYGFKTWVTREVQDMGDTLR